MTENLWRILAQTWRKRRSWWHSSTVRVLFGGMMLVMLGGCGYGPGVIFPPTNPAVQWPAAPSSPRIRYVGQLATNDDLKPGRSFVAAAWDSLIGRKDPMGMLTPQALCTDGGQRLLVADGGGRTVHLFDMNTRAYEQWSGPEAFPLQMPVGVTYDPSGRFLVADSLAGVIHVFGLTGQHQGVIGKGVVNRPVAIAVQASTGLLYVSDCGTHQVIVLTRDGAEVRRLGLRGSDPGQFNCPTSLVFDHQGRLYVCDALNFRVQQFSSDLQFVRSIGTKGDMPGCFSQPKAVAVDSDDHLYVVDNQLEAVQIFDSEGRLLLGFGHEGRASGEFWLPGSLCIDPSDRIWVADTYNRRVQVFDYVREVKP